MYNIPGNQTDLLSIILDLYIQGDLYSYEMLLCKHEFKNHLIKRVNYVNKNRKKN